MKRLQQRDWRTCFFAEDREAGSELRPAIIEAALGLLLSHWAQCGELRLTEAHKFIGLGHLEDRQALVGNSILFID